MLTKWQGIAGSLPVGSGQHPGLDTGRPPRMGRPPDEGGSAPLKISAQ